jgi:predicted outer membrane repeat protein
VLSGGAACALLLVAATSASAATFTVTNGSESGAGSLADAIDQANADDSTDDLINFTYSGPIALTASLPQITSPVTIDGPGPSNLNITRSPSATTQFQFLGVAPDTGDTVTIRNLTFSWARATNVAGGALGKSGHGTLVIDSVVFNDNQAPVNGEGGAVFFSSGFTSIRNSTFTNNQADFGGAVLGDQSAPDDVGSGEVVNSTFAGNKATSFGGAIYTNVSQIKIASSTLVDNIADSDGASPGNGGGTYNGGDALTFSVANTLYAGNQSGSGTPNQCAGSHTSFGYNLRETGEVDCAGFIQTGDTVDPDAAMLGTLGSNGGPTPTIALIAGNPAIDAGNPAALGGAFPACPTTDQRGFSRGGAAGRCDIGAFELNATPPGGGGGTTTPPAVGSTFDLKAAIKKCKKKFRKGKKRKKCIKRAKKRALA